MSSGVACEGCHSVHSSLVHAIGIDIGGTKVAAGPVAATGELLAGLELARSVDDRHYQARALATLGRIESSWGDIQRALDRYRRDSRERRELPDVFKTVECLRWRQKLADAELRALRSPEGSLE